MVQILSFKNSLLLHKKKFLWLIFIAIGISTIPPPVSFGGSGLDASGLIAIPWISFKNFQFGHDINFIFGPLGYLYLKAFVVPSLWLESVFYSLFAHSFFIVSMALLVTKLPIRWKDNLLILLLIFPLAFLTSHTLTIDDKLEISLSVFLYLVITRNIDTKYNIPLLIFVSISLAIEFLIRFNMAVAGLSIVIMYSMISIAKKESKNAIVISVSYFFFILILWLASNQHLTNLPSYFINGIVLSSGYSYGDASPGPMYQVYEGLIGIALVIILFVYSLIVKAKNLLIFILLNGVLLFESFKHGFIRHDLHVVYYFFTYGVFFLSAYIIYKYDYKNVENNKNKFIILMALVLMAVLCVVNLDYIYPDLILPDISQTISRWQIIVPLASDKSYQTHVLESIQDVAKSNYQLDAETIRYIGNKTMDILPWEIALPWVYDFNWSPNPTLQSFMILSPQSDKMNAEHFSGENAPKVLLYSYGSIDARYPLFDAPLTFATILHNYQYVNTSGNFAVLLSYDPKNSTWGTEEDLGSMEVKVGEPIVIPKYNSGYEFANIDLKFSNLGKLMNLFYKPSIAHLRFKFSDSTYSDEFKFIPMVSNDGVFVSQYVYSIGNLTSLFSGKITPNIDEMIIYVDDPVQYEHNIKVKFVGVPAHVSMQEDKMPDWNSLSLTKGGKMAIDFIGNSKYAYTQKINITNYNDMSMQFIDVKGWAFDDLAKDGNVKTFLVLRDEKNEFTLPTQKVFRSDLPSVFGVDSYKYAGWETSLNTKDFGHECYSVSVRILRSNDHEYFDLGRGAPICFN